MTEYERDKALQKATDLIAKHGCSMTRRQLNKALAIWDKLAMAECDQKGENRNMTKSNDRPTVRAAAGGTPVITRPTVQRQFSPYQDPRTGASWSGHQLAAIRAGLDPHTPGLESMSFGEMQEAAGQQLERSVQPLRHAAGLHLNRD